MSAFPKFPARNALAVIQGLMSAGLGLRRYPDGRTSKVFLYGIGLKSDRQFALLIGDKDKKTGEFSAKSTRLLFEPCDLPLLPGIERCASARHGSRGTQSDSRLAPPNQVSCLVADEHTLVSLLRWYAGAEPSTHEVSETKSVERFRDAAVHAGFDRFHTDDRWLILGSTLFEATVGLLDGKDGHVCVGFSDLAVGERIAIENGLDATRGSEQWPVVLNAVLAVEQLEKILRRVAVMSKELGEQAFRDFVAVSGRMPEMTEVQRLVAQRVGQDLFRRRLLAYWGGQCSVTRLDVESLLRASHIKPWRDCESDEERLDALNGLLLAPHLDALFDAGWITFDDSGGVVVVDELSDAHRMTFGLTGQECVKGLTKHHLHYLRWHRDKVFRARMPTAVSNPDGRKS